MLSPKQNTKPNFKLGEKLTNLFGNKLRFSRKAAGQTLLGIDFGSQRIHALALNYLAAQPHQSPSYQLQAMASVDIPSGAIVDHQLQNIPQVVRGLRQLRRLLKVRRTGVATAVSGSGVTTKILSVPNSLPPEMLHFHVQQAAIAQLPFSLTDINLDFEILKPSTPHADRDQILLSAARIELVQDRVNALRQAGWQTQVVDIGAHALARAVCFLLEPARDQLIGVLELSADSLTFIVVADGDITYQRLQPLTVVIEESELHHPEFSHHERSHHESSHQESSYQGYLEQISSQVQRQLQSFCAHSGQAAPSILMLFGGCASELPQVAMSQLACSLSQQLGISVQLPNFSRVFGGTGEPYPEAAGYGTALGLALRRADYV